MHRHFWPSCGIFIVWYFSTSLTFEASDLAVWTLKISQVPPALPLPFGVVSGSFVSHVAPSSAHSSILSDLQFCSQDSYAALFYHSEKNFSYGKRETVCLELSIQRLLSGPIFCFSFLSCFLHFLLVHFLVVFYILLFSSSGSFCNFKTHRRH